MDVINVEKNWLAGLGWDCSASLTLLESCLQSVLQIHAELPWRDTLALGDDTYFWQNSSRDLEIYR